jgi:hypothetical protein
VTLVKPIAWSGLRGVQQNLFCNFLILLQVSTNFESLKQYLEFKTIENELKIHRTLSDRNRPVATVRGPAAYHARLAGWLAGPRPGGPV